MSAAAVLLAVFCVLCYTGQNFFSKMFSLSYTGPAPAATPVFAAVYGLFTGIVTLAYNGFGFHGSSATLLSRAVFREKLNSWMIAGILGAIGALVLLSL